MRPLLPLLLLLLFSSVSAQKGPVSCPLDFTILRRLAQDSQSARVDTPTQCRYILQGIHLVLSVYLKNTNSFIPPLDSAESCWASYQLVVDSFLPNFDIRKTCGFQTPWISQGCMNITSRAEFEALIPPAELHGVVSACNHSLHSSACSACTTSVATLHASYLSAEAVGNVSDCRVYAQVYAAAIANSEGPTDPGTIYCLFSLSFTTNTNSKSKHTQLVIVVVVVIAFGVVLGGLGLGFWYVRRKRGGKLVRSFERTERSLDFSGLDSINGNNTIFVKFGLEEIKEATKNFSRDYIIGRGGYGNVYKGVLSDGSEVAVKRFKNCSAAGDASFSHEVEVIASVRHVNLLAMRGYCTATTLREGYQRIIVCDLVTNGSLHDHLFGSTGKNLTWPIRQRIALGTAKGLAYLHYGAQPSIIHRDIKASNILLDEKFEAKVADFGLAKFTPEGMTHMSTRVAGTMGYVAPEYALYGQLTERSDVYSFGIVLLELLSGKKALMAVKDGQPTLLSDWAWSLVRENRTLDVLDETMPGLGPAEVMEKYVLIAVLCSHPQLYARPTMDQVVKMLDTDVPVPSIPERPISIIADIDDIEKSVSSFGSGRMSTVSGYQPYTPRGHSDTSSTDIS